MTITADRVLECQGESCPMPVVKTKRVLDEMEPGQVLEVRATDRGSVADLQAWCKQSGHQYIGLKEGSGLYIHYIRKASEYEVKQEMSFPATMSNEELQQRLEAGEDIIVLDVREPAEYAFGHIPGALSIPLGQLLEHLDKLDPSRKYAVICRTGNRSDMSCRLLMNQGFAHVTNVLPGMSMWKGPLESEF